jgi:tripartite-type tricarboxylate transporter receptor subunit TctC
MEAGVGYEMSVWAGLFAPKGAAPDVVAKLSAALDRALDEPVVRERLGQLGGSIPAKAERTPAAFESFVRSEIARWAPILAATRSEK